MLTQQNYSLYGVDQGKLMDTDTCMKLHIKQHEIAIEHLRGIYKNLPTMQMEMQMMPQKLSDKFYAETGIESIDLDQATEFLGLEEGEEYKAESADYIRRVQELQTTLGK